MKIHDGPLAARYALRQVSAPLQYAGTNLSGLFLDLRPQTDPR